MAARLMTADEEPSPDMMLKSSMVIKNECCKRAFIRGAFLTSGSMSDPEKFYHLRLYVLHSARRNLFSRFWRDLHLMQE